MEGSWNEPLPRGRHHLSREEVQASQRRRILMAMIEEVAARGYAGTSVAHVTTRAGVSRKSFYEQFSDKQDCYFAAYDMAMEIQGASVVRATRAVERGAPPIEYFRAVVRAFLEGIAAHPAAARTLMIELYAVGPEASRRKVARGRKAMGAMMAPLGLTDEDGNLSFDGRVILGAIASLAQQLIAEDRTADAPALCDPFVDWVARHLDCIPRERDGAAVAPTTVGVDG